MRIKKKKIQPGASKNEVVKKATVAKSSVQKAQPIIFTDAAAAKVKSLIEEENNDALKLRAYITGGGCSGFQYGFTFDEQVAEDDIQIKKNDVMLLVDAMSFQYLVGAEIDYVEDVQGSQFVIRNPNAKTTCGCGSSFSIEEKEEDKNT